MDSDCASVASTQSDEDSTQLSTSITCSTAEESLSGVSNSMSQTVSEVSTAAEISAAEVFSAENNVVRVPQMPRRNASRQRGRRSGPIRNFNPHKMSFMSAVTPPILPPGGIIRTPMMIGSFSLRGRPNRSSPASKHGVRRPRSPTSSEDNHLDVSQGEEYPLQTIFLSPSEMTHMKPFHSHDMKRGRDFPRFTQDSANKSGRMSYPLIYLSPAGSIVIVLRPDLIIETASDHSIRVVSHGKFSAFVGGRGLSSSIVHSDVRILHSNNSVCGRFASTNDKLVIIGNTGVLFTMDHLREAYLVSSGMKGTSAVSMDQLHFPKLGSDYTLLQFYTDSQTGSAFIPLCMELVDTAIYDRRQDGSLIMQINGMTIRHSANGDFIIDARPRHISFTDGNIHVRTSHIDMGIQKTETAYVKFGTKRVHVSVSGMVVSDGSSCTSMDTFMADIGERYVEQLTTTAETLRRRFVSYYDGIFVASQRIATASERAKEILEPAAYDFQDHVNLAMAQTEPISKLNTEWRHTLVEVYLAISVLMVGLSYGQMAGAYSLKTVMETVFDRYVEVGLLFLIPAYIFLLIKKNAAMDDMERRSYLFGMAMSMGIIAGHLWPSVTSMAPAVHFIPPLVFALLIDNEIIPTPLASIDRLQFFIMGAAIATGAALVAGILPLGYISPAVSLCVGLHSAFFILHCQLACQAEKDKTFAVGEYQFFYLLLVFLMQLFFSALFGTNPFYRQQPVAVVMLPSQTPV